MSERNPSNEPRRDEDTPKKSPSLGDIPPVAAADESAEHARVRREGGAQAQRILIGLVVGLLLGLGARYLATHPEAWPVSGNPAAALDWFSKNIAAPVGGIFLNMMFVVVIPLIFSSLILGIAGLGDGRTVGRIGLRVLLGTVFLSGMAVFIGITLANIAKPGTGMSPEVRAQLTAQTQTDGARGTVKKSEEAKSFGQTVTDLVSRNPIEDAANLFNPNPNYKGGGIIAFLVTCVIIGFALLRLPPERAGPIVTLLESIQELSMVVIGFAMKLAPFGVAALIYQTASRVGLELFSVLGSYVGVVILGLLLHLCVTYSIALIVGARRNPVTFFKSIAEVIVTAFSTSSSNATLPTAMRVAETRAGIPKDVSRFVLTVGATANQNGTALFEGITVLFLAQFYGIDLSFGQQVTVVLMSVLAGVGTAGVPGGSLPLIAILLTQVGIPAEGIGIILGVDRLLDMSRTVINVVGDLVLSAIAGAGYRERQFDDDTADVLRG